MFASLWNKFSNRKKHNFQSFRFASKTLSFAFDVSECVNTIEACAISGGVYTTVAWAAAGRVCTTEKCTAPEGVYTTGAWGASGRVFTTEECTASGGVYTTGAWAASGRVCTIEACEVPGGPLIGPLKAWLSCLKFGKLMLNKFVFSNSNSLYRWYGESFFK